MGTTEVQLSEDDKSLLEKLTVPPAKEPVGGGYIHGGSAYGSRETTAEQTNDLLNQILDVLKDIRDNLVIETSTPQNPADETFWDKYKELPPWRPYPYPSPYQGVWITHAPDTLSEAQVWN